MTASYCCWYAFVWPETTHLRPHIFICNVYFYAYFLKIFDFEDFLCTVAASYCCWYAFVWSEAVYFYLLCLISCLFPKDVYYEINMFIFIALFWRAQNATTPEYKIINMKYRIICLCQKLFEWNNDVCYEANIFIFIALLDCHFYSLRIAAAATSGRDKYVGLLLVVSLTRAASRPRDAH